MPDKKTKHKTHKKGKNTQKKNKKTLKHNFKKYKELINKALLLMHGYSWVN